MENIWVNQANVACIKQTINAGESKKVESK